MNKLLKLFFVFFVFLYSVTAFSATVNVLEFNDFHGSLRAKDKNVGMAKLVSAIKEEEKKNPDTIVVSGGDNYQGSALSNLTFGAPVSQMMKMAGVIASSVGNYEFDWGIQHFRPWEKDGHFVFLAANVFNKQTGKPVKWAKPYIIVKIHGIKIAFIGLSTITTPYVTLHSHVANLDFEDASQAAQQWIDYLKAGKAPQGKPDVIIALTHIPSAQDFKTHSITGKELKHLCRDTKGLDAVISAHSHRFVNGYVNKIPVIQAASHGRALGELRIIIDDKNNKVQKIIPDVWWLDADSLHPDSKALSVYNKYEKKLAPLMNKVIGKATGEFERISDQGLSVFGKWTCDTLRQQAHVQIVIQNGGLLRRNLHKGSVTIGDMYEIIPFDNSLVKMQLLGGDIKKIVAPDVINTNISSVQYSGLDIQYDKKAKITSITLSDGSPLKMNKYYSVAVNSFMYEGGDGYDFKNAKDVVDTYIPIRDILIKVIKEKKVITPTPVI